MPRMWSLVDADTDYSDSKASCAVQAPCQAPRAFSICLHLKLKCFQVNQIQFNSVRACFSLAAAAQPQLSSSSTVARAVPSVPQPRPPSIRIIVPQQPAGDLSPPPPYQAAPDEVSVFFFSCLVLSALCSLQFGWVSIISIGSLGLNSE